MPIFGVEDKLQDLYEREGPGVSRLAYVLTRDGDAAQDVVQEAFARIARRMFTLRSDQHARSYLYRVAINLSHGRGRRLKRERQLSVAAATSTTHVPPLDIGERDEMWRALLELPARQRAALFLRYYQDESEAAAAETLGCSASALKSLVNRGLRNLRAILSEDTDE
jgi:RNA polymerase sigma factor (sigma-70 family)